MEIHNRLYTFEEVKAVYSRYIHDPEDLKAIEDAYEFADERHMGQVRKSGDPYISHCIGVAMILAELQAGPKTIMTGLLHDTIEDTGTTKEEIEQRFGSEVADLVEALTKVTRLSDYKNVEFTAENHRKIFVAMAKDIRAILVKLCDRLHNMRTLQFQPPAKQERISKETLEVYEPIARRLGLYTIQTELEDLSLWYLENDKYREIERMKNDYIANANEYLNSLKKQISQILDKSKIPYTLKDRVKSVYSIYKKMYQKSYTFDQIYDILAVRIITETEQNCYEILGYVHANFKPVPGRFKDYIAMPKVNMYQSLHTTVFTDTGHVFEIQIRTEKMDEVAEGGIAAHWRYKEGTSYDYKKEQREIEDKLHWLKDLATFNDENSKDNTQEYISNLNHDIFDANVYVFTPKGNVISLPNGATPIDFAYRIHSDLGDHLQGAKINGTLVNLSTELKTGDIVEVIVNKNSSPNSEWLNIATTNFAKSRIKKYLIHQNADYLRDENIKKGRQALLDGMRERKINIDLNQLITKKVLTYFQCPTIEDIFVLVAGKSIGLSNILDQTDAVEYVGKKSDTEITTDINSRHYSKNTTDDVILANGDTVMISLASCCTPIPGDEIIGFVSTGQGVKVHRIECPNVTRQGAADRLIQVKWNPDSTKQGSYPVDIAIECHDRKNLLIDILGILSGADANVIRCNAKLHAKTSTTTITMTLLVRNHDMLSNFMHSIYSVKGVYAIHRLVH